MTLSRALLAALAFDALVVLVVLGAALLGKRSDAAGEGLKWAYVLFLAAPVVAAGVLALVPVRPLRWLALAVAGALPVLLIVASVVPSAWAPIAARRRATGASEFSGAAAEVAAAIAAGDSAAVRRTVTERRVDLAAEGKQRRPLLHFAIERRPALVPLLVRLGADPNRPASDGETPLEMAVADPMPGGPPNVVGSLEALRLLLEAGATPNVTSRFDVPLLEIAIRGRRPDQVRLLLDHGADPKTVGQQGYSMPMWAVRARQWAIAADLLRRGAPATHRSTHGDDLRSVYADAARHADPLERRAIDDFRAAARAAGLDLPAPERQ